MRTKSHQARHLQAKLLIEEWKESERVRESVTWIQGKILYELKKDNLYKYLYGGTQGDNNERSWAWFLREIGIPSSTDQFKRSLYATWVLRLGYQPRQLTVHTRKLHRACGYVTKENAEEILAQADALAFQDFIEWLKEEKSPVSKDSVA